MTKNHIKASATAVFGSALISLLLTYGLNAAVLVFATKTPNGLDVSTLAGIFAGLFGVFLAPCYRASLWLFQDVARQWLVPPKISHKPVPTPGIDDAVRAAAMTARKNEYKNAYSAERAIRIQYALNGIILSSALLAALAVAISSAAQALATYAMFPNGTAKQTVPWFIDLMQSIVVGPCMFFLAFVQGRFWAPRIADGIATTRATRACFVGTAASALMFLFHLGPELVGLVFGSGYRINLPALQLEVPWEIWNGVQRLVYIPVAAAIGFYIGFAGSVEESQMRPPLTMSEPKNAASSEIERKVMQSDRAGNAVWTKR